MVHVATPRPSLGGALGQGFGEGLQSAINYNVERNRTLQGLQQAKAGAQGAQNPTDLLFSLLEATAGRPGAEKSLGALFPHLLTQLQAKGTQGVNYAGEGGGRAEAPQGVDQSQNQGQPRAREPLGPITSRMQQPGFLGTSQELGTAQQGAGNLPQTATGGEKRPVYGATEVFDQGKRIAREQSAGGLPTTVPQGVEIAKQINEENKAYNNLIEQERQQRVQSQKNYGDKASAALEKIMPGATDEQLAAMRKIGENAAGQQASEADIDKIVAQKATQFKNTISNVEKDLSAPRFQNSIFRRFEGSQKSFNQAAADMRIKLKPLLDLGLYDTARTLLTKQGYYPEERESIINPLSDNQKAQLNLVPKASVEGEGFFTPNYANPNEERYSPQQMQTLKENLSEFLKANPSASIVLARKGFEDRNYDWRAYKDALNELIESGEFKPNADQFNQLITLDTPPLSNLEKPLHELKLIGR